MAAGKKENIWHRRFAHLGVKNLEETQAKLGKTEAELLSFKESADSMSRGNKKTQKLLEEKNCLIDALKQQVKKIESEQNATKKESDKLLQEKETELASVQEETDVIKKRIADMEEEYNDLDKRYQEEVEKSSDKEERIESSLQRVRKRKWKWKKH